MLPGSFTKNIKMAFVTVHVVCNSFMAIAFGSKEEKEKIELFGADFGSGIFAEVLYWDLGLLFSEEKRRRLVNPPFRRDPGSATPPKMFDLVKDGGEERRELPIDKAGLLKEASKHATDPETSSSDRERSRSAFGVE
mmetsp:Transcript_46819/g.134888  ORF Transcript_46819/g.134888 Transcript_46819/m.134888 type:complete len:137 (+) Transcript_46819:1145-1555(+)